MRRTPSRFVVGISAAVTAAVVGFSSTPASAAPTQSGLVFYSAARAEVASYPAPDGLCRTFPASATVLVGYSNFNQVIGYTSAGCTGQEVGLGTLASFPAGKYKSFIGS